MPKRTDIHKIMVIGSGPIIIGQAAEFDYSGTQACLALREEGYEVVLVNSNPATIMTDTTIADKVYIEPLTVESISRIIRQEYPDAILPTLGGQVGLNMALALAKTGILDELNIELLGTRLSSIEQAEDREKFKELCKKLGEPVPPSKTVNTVKDALEFGDEIGYPIIVRPAFTMGGTGGGICYSHEELAEIAKNGLELSPVTECLIEKSIAGYKEIEFEVMRDHDDNAMIVCCMENFDPVGIHTGDSIVFSPSQTLSDKEYQMLRDCSLRLIRALKIEGGCNVQLALDPNSFDYDVIEVNPRVSRSSALASKATGYPIAKMAAKIAIGMTLDEIKNPVTGTTYAEFEPALDYVVCKIPRWPFDKFSKADRTLGTQMKATGEVMAIGRTAEEAMQKAVRSLEIDEKDLFSEKAHQASDEEIEQKLVKAQDDRLFYLAEAFRRGYSLEDVHELTKINYYFLDIVSHMVEMETAIKANKGSIEILRLAKKYGFSDPTIAALWDEKADRVRDLRKQHGIIPVYKMVDTCAAEFESTTPYFYSTHEGVIKAAEELGYPVLVRPSYVLGGKAMKIVYSKSELEEYLYDHVDIAADHPILVDDYLDGRECDVDAICDGHDVLLPGIMEHIEHAGVHSGDSMAVYPPQTFTDDVKEKIMDVTRKLALTLNCVGIMNIQFIVRNGEVYVIEVNPRASRTVPFLSKITGIEMAQVATKVIMGENLAEQGYSDGLAPEPEMISVKAPVFSFSKLADVDSYLGPEMKSTGEVMGSDHTFAKALYKAFAGAKMQLPKNGNVLLTIEDRDKEKILPVAKRFARIGYRIFATKGTADFLKNNGLHVDLVTKVHENENEDDNILNELRDGKIDLVINTMGHDIEKNSDGFIIRQMAIQQNVPLLTALDTADALLTSLENRSFATDALK